MDFIDIIAITGWVCDNSTKSIRPVVHLVKEILNIVRIIVPIVLVIMTSFDIAKKVINPDDKDGQKKIMIRAIAALLVFLAPAIIDFTLDVVAPGKTDPNSSLAQCWKQA